MALHTRPTANPLRNLVFALTDFCYLMSDILLPARRLIDYFLPLNLVIHHQSKQDRDM